MVGIRASVLICAFLQACSAVRPRDDQAVHGQRKSNSYSSTAIQANIYAQMTRLVVV